MGERQVVSRAFSGWPTLLVAGGTYVAFGLVTWLHTAIPWWVLLPVGGYLVCLHGSLQHEAAHGHPFRRRWLNSLLVFPSLWLWLPYPLYRDSHLRHHRDEHLTEPLEDPESYYVTPEQWARMGRWHRQLRLWMNTLAGRLLLWPVYVVAWVGQDAIRRLCRGERAAIHAWLSHIPAVAVVVVWVVWVCGMPFWAYVLLFAYPGLSLTLLRSFAEHRAAHAVGHRTAVIESGPVMSLLYLNNNLHALHHAEPGLAWHLRPARYRARRAELLEANNGYLFRGYREIIRRYLLARREPIVYPLG